MPEFASVGRQLQRGACCYCDSIGASLRVGNVQYFKTCFYLIFLYVASSSKDVVTPCNVLFFCKKAENCASLFCRINNGDADFYGCVVAYTRHGAA